MTTPIIQVRRITGPRWLLFAVAAGAAAVAIIAVVVFVVFGDNAQAEGQAAQTAPVSSEEVAVDYDNLEVSTIPYTEVTEWSSKTVEMDGELPEGTMIYRNSPSNPGWVKINRFNGDVTYEPKAKGIQLRPYDVTFLAELSDGETLNITTTVEVTKYD